MGSAVAWGGCLGPGREHPERPPGQPRSSFHFSFPSRPKRRDLLWEGPNGGLVSGRCGHWSVVSDQWSAEVDESRNTAVNRIRLRGPVHCQLGGAWKWGTETALEMLPSFASTWKVVCRVQEKHLTHLASSWRPKMTSLARARRPFQPLDAMPCRGDECIVCSFLQGLDLQRRVARPPTARGSSGLGFSTE